MIDSVDENVARLRQQFTRFKTSLIESLRKPRLVSAATQVPRSDSNAHDAYYRSDRPDSDDNSDEPLFATVEELCSEFESQIQEFREGFAARINDIEARLPGRSTEGDMSPTTVQVPTTRSLPDRSAAEEVAIHASTPASDGDRTAQQEEPSSRDSSTVSSLNPLSPPASSETDSLSTSSYRTLSTSLGSSDEESRFSLTVEQLGEQLIPNLVEFLADDKFTGKVSIQEELGVNWKELLEQITPPDGHDHNAIQHARSRLSGFSHLYRSSPAKFKLPNFSQLEDDAPSPADIEDFLQGIPDHHPKDPIPYYVGPLPESALDSLFPSGNKLQRLGDIPGCNTLYGLAGDRYSGTGWHCEDAQWGSINYNICGWKPWTLIKTHHTQKFEAFIRRLWKCGDCPQFIRHLSLLTSPTRLREEGIDFDIILAGPGDLVVTQPGQYHLVTNYTASFSVAINIAFPDREAIPTSLVVCDECGLYRLNHENIVRIGQRKALPSSSASNEKRSRRQSAGASQDSNDGGDDSEDGADDESGRARPAKRTRQKTSTGTSGTSTKTPVDITLLANRVSDKKAILQLASLIHYWKAVDEPLKTEFRSIGSDNVTQLQQYDHLNHITRGRSIEYAFLELLTKTKLARTIDASRSDSGRQRTDPGVISVILNNRGKADTTKTRRAFQVELRRPRALNNVCGSYEGLLCLLPCGICEDDNISLKDYLEISDSMIPAFHSLLDNELTQTLCKIGKELQGHIWGHKERPIYRFESRSLQELEELSLEDLLVHLKPS